ncbi:uncharacterized protein [Typha angustifolia]|uniref:uncharacterized protein isoform X1 n=1 Tax=Typha angustifolia TaxID=59011 RepID=UPI003C307B4C
MMFSSCPFCHASVLSSELEWHANNHFAEDELEKDMEFAQQIALAPPSPRNMDISKDYGEPVNAGWTLEASNSSTNKGLPSYRPILDQEVSCLVGLQIRSTFHKIEGGLMTLLRSCLNVEGEYSRSIISRHVDHYQSIESEDSGWGCGWRNIQMLSSYLLSEREEARHVMFGGSGFVPDIPSLQRWLEIAWRKGFDIIGSNSFHHKIYGCKKWIGTTECASLFRSFGLRARIVDFDSTGLSERSKIGKSRGKGITKQLYGPLDKFLQHYDDLQVGPSSHVLCSKDHDSSCFSKCTMTSSDNSNSASGHQVLIDWIWNYFMNKSSGRQGSSQRVIVSEKTPLYLQHDGHSRTIVGIQMQKGQPGSLERYFLLVLDPAHRTTALERSLGDNKGWQKMIKRGVHTLKKPQYQLCYVDPGIADAEEMEQLKTIDSILVKF